MAQHQIEASHDRPPAVVRIDSYGFEVEEAVDQHLVAEGPGAACREETDPGEATGKDEGEP